MSTLAYLSFNDYILQNGVFGKVSNKQIIDYNDLHVGTNQIAEEETTPETIEEALEEAGYIAPWEYVPEETTTNTREGEGYFKIRKKPNPNKHTSTPIQATKYFWCEDLKNWCTYIYNYSNPILNNMAHVWWFIERSPNYNVKAITHDQYGNLLQSVRNYSLEQIQEIMVEKLGTSSSENWYFHFQSTYGWEKNRDLYTDVNNYYRGFAMNSLTSEVEKGISESTRERRGLSPILQAHDGKDYLDKYGPNHSNSRNAKFGKTTIHLCVWNGRNGFVPINALTVQTNDETFNTLQHYFINYEYGHNPDRKDNIIQHRGTYLSDCSGLWFVSDSTLEKGDYTDGKNFGNKDVEKYFICKDKISGHHISDWYYENNSTMRNKTAEIVSATSTLLNNPVMYTNNTEANGGTESVCIGDPHQYSPVQIVHGIVLKNYKDYSIVDKETFQCVRPGKPYFFNEKPWKYRNHSSNECTRAGMATGNPAIMRTATGEVVLCTYLAWGGMHDVCGLTSPDFLNEMCINMFGDGRDKTIAKNWLHLEKTINTNEEIATALEDITNKDTVTLKPDCIKMSNKTKHSPELKIKFNVNDVNVSVEDLEEHTDFATKW